MANPTIGFIGYGNMAQAIAEGLVNAGVVNGGDIVACAAHYDRLERNAAKLGAKAVHTAAQVAEVADVVVIAIKPYQIEAVISPIVDKLAQPNTIVASIAAGWDLNKFRDLFGTSFEQAHIQCTIPNTPMAVGKGVLVTEIDNTLTQEQTETFESLFSSISLIERVDGHRTHGHRHVHRRLRAGLHRHVHRSIGRCRCEIWIAACHRVSSGR